MKQLYFFIAVLLLSTFNFNAQTSTDVTYIAEPFGLKINGNDLYITASDGGGLFKIDISAPTPTTAVQVVYINNPRYIEMDGNDLFTASGGNIYKTDISASTPTASVLVSGLNYPYGLALNGNDLYIAEVYANKISKIDITASSPTPIDVVTGLNNPFDLVLNGNDLYIAEYGSNKVSKIDISVSTPTPTDVVTGITNPWGLTLNGNDLFIANNLKISKIDITATSPATPIDVVTGLQGCYEMEVNGTDLYYAEFRGNKVSKFNLSSLSISENRLKNNLTVLPNPSTGFINILGLTQKETYTIYNILGAKQSSGTISLNENIDIQNLNNGLYFIKFDNGDTLKFLKQ
ncbi:T9SS type A sorting domain-containing protein [Hwangdonia lutea]|uniref:T9SS type A sorting domain-containing protein n=1 Tax=Hwangdonia lutea TaxID=3075823 RepID=A0AA97EMB9_9FLAO|nr:T9SS type A sorting domain-containing protein [Hwangdonia sp. SCSIO 19198]WOD43054.1 T9SS type A sorting domain-containing protein [Hwangdonia sp. SCSIO 19198]